MSEKEEKTESLFQKIGTNLKKELNHRTKSNVIASYVITWIILSWKSILYLIFSSDSLNTKLSSNYTQPTWGTFLFPLIGVGIYLLLVPILESTINVISNWITRPINNKIREQQYNLKIDEIEDEIQIEVERNKIFEEMSNESELEKLTKSNSFLEKKIEELNTLLQSKDNTISNLSNEIQLLNKRSSSNKLTIQQIRNLHRKLIVSFPKVLDRFRSSFSSKTFEYQNALTDNEIEVMIFHNLITFEDSLGVYQLTDKGESLINYINSRSNNK